MPSASSLPTLVLLKHLDEIVAFLNDLLLCHPFAHPKVSQCRQGKASHFFPGVPICKQNPW